jgi:MFS transporter, DHA1 family, multidrug resistance protein
MVAPLVGGFLDRHFGWRSIFLVMVALAVAVAAAAAAFLHETAARHEGAGLASLFRGYPELLRNRSFLGYTLALSSTTAAFFAFVAGAPFVVVEVMGASPDVYGVYFLFNAGTYMVGNFLTGRFGQRIGSERLTRYGLYLSVASGASAVLCMLVLPWTPAALFLPLMLNGIGNGLTVPGGTAAALSVRPDLAGTAAGLVGATQLGLGALAAVVVGSLVTLAPTALVWGILICILLGWIALATLVGRR